MPSLPAAAGPSVCLIGAPTDAGAGVRGACMGPDALRVASLAAALVSQGCRVTDRGNLAGPSPVPPPSPAQTIARPAGPHHLAQVVAWNRAVFQAVSASLARGEVPMLLGGDHALAVGSISAVAAHCRQAGRRLRVLWLDAHADVNTVATSPSGNLHGMPVACLLGQGPSDLVGWSGQPAAFGGADLAFLGIRSVDVEERQAIQVLGLRAYDMRHIDEHGMRDTMTEALQGIDAGTHLHLSFDLDCLDPADAPGVGTPVPGGPTYREMQLCMEMVADTGRLGSVDVVEINPARDIRNRTAEVAVDLVRTLFGASTLLRPAAP